MDGITRQPLVTVALIAANSVIYFRPQFLHSIIPHIDQVWFNPNLIIKNNDLKRFSLSPLYHVNNSHFIDNMVSILWTGIDLENSMRSVQFASMVVSLLTLSQSITILLSQSLLIFFGRKKSYYDNYSVGFSGVIFAMKVVSNSLLDVNPTIYGIPIPSRYAAWAELFLIQMSVPGSSFLVHLGGILAGAVYLKYLRRNDSNLNSSSLIFRDVKSLLNWSMRFLDKLFGFWRGWITDGGIVGRPGRNARPALNWRCPNCTNENSILLNVCEMCGTNRTSSTQRNRTSSTQWNRRNYYDFDGFSIDELREMRRRRRIGRLGRWCEDGITKIIRQLN